MYSLLASGYSAFGTVSDWTGLRGRLEPDFEPGPKPALGLLLCLADF